MSIQLGMIGGGVMGEAILSRLLHRNLYSPDAVLISDPAENRRTYLEQTYGVQTTTDNSLVVQAEAIVLLAIKPQIFPVVAADLGEAAIAPTACVLSILAGTPLSRLEAAFPGQAVIRAMPNTPAIVGAGMTAIALGQHVQSHHLTQARQVLEAVGDVVDVPEYLMDAVTGLSGSGPGYVALVIEALADGGVAAGLPRPIALQLAIQTVRGTAELIQSENLHPGVLKDRVTSPGGTTITGIAKLEELGLRSALIEAVRAASARSQELGQS